MPLPRLSRQRLFVAIGALVTGVGAVTMIRVDRARQQLEFETERAKILEQIGTTSQVIVAAQDIPIDTPLEAKMVELMEVPERFVQPYAARTPSDVAGKVTSAPFAKGEQLLLNKLRRPDEAVRTATLSSFMPKGKRAITVGMDTLSGVGGFVQPGDAVDVLWTLNVPGPKEQGPQAVTLTLFQGIQVLATGARTTPARPTPLSAEEAKAASGERLDKPFTVTLALSPQEAALLLFARQQGALQLSLRSTKEDEQRVPIAPANIATLMETALGPEAARAGLQQQGPSQTRTVEVYKGLERSVETVPAAE
jgi:pilus assembly protein CpaB